MATRNRVIGAVGIGALAYGAYALSGSSKRKPTDLIKTPGVSNIEKRFTSGGAGPDYTPGVASPRGDQHNAKGRNHGSTGFGDKEFRDQAGEMLGGTKVIARADPKERPEWKDTKGGQKVEKIE
ncbi:MAG: hypothetical protein LQ340_001432 [Diploschistes diacapsis]|nr:MAG: hypothetical protein LQ340_001432 [Diploschistes diacapsis]